MNIKVRDQAEQTYKHTRAYFCLIPSFLPCDVRQLTIVLDLRHRCHQYLANWLRFTYYNTMLHGSDIKARETLSFVGKVGLRPHRCRDRGHTDWSRENEHVASSWRLLGSRDTGGIPPLHKTALCHEKRPWL